MASSSISPLRLALLERRMTGRALAAAIGKHDSAVSRIVNGLACDVETQQAIAAALEMTVEELWPSHGAASDHISDQSTPSTEGLAA